MAENKKPEKKKKRPATGPVGRVCFRILKGLIRLFYGKAELLYMAAIPEKNVVFVANHAQMNGPIVGELFFPKNTYIWCAGEMMHWREVPAYAYRDFWSQKPRWQRPFFRLLAFLITPFAVCLFNNARTISLYHDGRAATAFKESVRHLSKGDSILLFPEKDETDNNVVYAFQESFSEVARLYSRRTGETVTFVPVYVAPALRKIYLGEGVLFDPAADAAEERRRIAGEMSWRITEMARALPPHRVVPYRNVPKKNYLSNKDEGEVPKA